LPFLADEALKRGYELPLPRGLSSIYYYVHLNIETGNVRVGTNGALLRNVSNFVNLGSKRHVNVAVGRFDAWLLPVMTYMASWAPFGTTAQEGDKSQPRRGSDLRFLGRHRLPSSLNLAQWGSNGHCAW
jgi:hypothetical protein